MTWYLDPDPIPLLDEIATAVNHRTAITHVLWTAFGKLEVPTDAMENLHKTTDHLRGAHNALGNAVVALTLAPRNTPPFAPAAVPMEMEKLRTEVPVDDPDVDIEELEPQLAALLDQLSPAELSELNMKLLTVADVVASGIPDPDKRRRTVIDVLEASGRLVNAAIHSAKAYRYARETFPSAVKDRWLDDFSWSVAGQRRDRKNLYLAEQPRPDQQPALSEPAPPPPPGFFGRIVAKTRSAFKQSIDVLANAFRR